MLTSTGLGLGRSPANAGLSLEESHTLMDSVAAKDPLEGSCGLDSQDQVQHGQAGSLCV